MTIEPLRLKMDLDLNFHSLAPNNPNVLYFHLDPIQNIYKSPTTPQ